MDPRRKELIHRLLDGELDRAAEQQLRDLAERDATFARALRSAEATQQSLHALPSPDGPAPAFAARVMSEIHAQPERSFRAWLRQPIAIPRWALATGLNLVACGLVLAIALPSGESDPVSTPGDGVASAVTGASAVTVEPPAAACQPKANALPYRFTVLAKGAARVTLVGDFNGWKPDATPMLDDNDDGVWTVRVPLAAGRYQYKFLIDGKQWIVDPEAAAYHVDGFGGRNAVVTL